MIVKEKLLLFIMFIIKLLNYLIPKNNNQILFESYPDFSDNPKALYDYIKSLNTNYRLIWTVNEINDKINVPQYKRFTLKRLWQFLRSKYIVTSHGIHPARAKNQVFVNVWHGMPLKAMGYAEEENRDVFLPFNFDDKNYYFIATSVVMKNALAACFNQDPRRIFVTGQPRNDKLKSCQKKILKIFGVDLEEYDKFVLFAPTFRKSDFREDGKFISHKFNLRDFSGKEFQEFLKEHEILCLVKFHPLEEKKAIKYFRSMENVKLIKTETLQENLIDLYDVLPCVDILITDYSSVYFDFLLLDKPIIFVVPDLDEYKKRRGFVLEPFEFWTPGPKVQNFKEFLEELEKSIKNPDYYREERMVINDLVNYYKDDKSSERIYKLVFEDKL
ncbi:MAG: CDP-glycerol glycerophosphotransferase family protein [Methanothermobacter sp.]|nr:CDP-glycerol glycerophosphotransferase family protein [Methanothermobacter sp.]